MYLVCDWCETVNHYRLPQIYRGNLARLCDSFGLELLFCENEREWPDFDSIFAYVGNRPTNSLLSNAGNLRWIHFGSVGTDRIDLRRARDLDVLVSNAGSIFSNAVALHVLTRVLHRVFFIGNNRSSGFDRKSWEERCYKLEDVLVTILGHGNIARSTCTSLYNNGLNVRAMTRDTTKHSPEYPIESLFSFGQPSVDKIHVIVNLLPSTPETFQFVNESFLSKFGEIGYYLNVGRLQTEKLKAVIDALASGSLNAAGWDVLRDEHSCEDLANKFSGRVDFTPHIAAFCKDHWVESYGLVKHNLQCLMSGDNAQMRNLLVG